MAQINLNTPNKTIKGQDKPLKMVVSKLEIQNSTLKSELNATAAESKIPEPDKVKTPKVKREILATLLSRKKFYKILIQKLEGYL